VAEFEETYTSRTSSGGTKLFQVQMDKLVKTTEIAQDVDSGETTSRQVAAS
jgi:hypothetical protein